MDILTSMNPKLKLQKLLKRDSQITEFKSVNNSCLSIKNNRLNFKTKWKN